VFGRTIRDIDVGGAVLPARQFVMLSAMSSARDEEAYERPGVSAAAFLLWDKQRRDRRRAFGSAVRRGELPGPTLLISHASHRLCVDRIMAAARSPMITHGAIVLPVATLGMTDPSATRSLSIP
jgi:hypothetical protein